MNPEQSHPFESDVPPATYGHPTYPSAKFAISVPRPEPVALTLVPLGLSSDSELSDSELSDELLSDELLSDELLSDELSSEESEYDLVFSSSAFFLASSSAFFLAASSAFFLASSSAFFLASSATFSASA